MSDQVKYTRSFGEIVADPNIERVVMNIHADDKIAVKCFGYTVGSGLYTDFTEFNTDLAMNYISTAFAHGFFPHEKYSQSDYCGISFRRNNEAGANATAVDLAGWLWGEARKMPTQSPRFQCSIGEPETVKIEQFRLPEALTVDYVRHYEADVIIALIVPHQSPAHDRIIYAAGMGKDYEDARAEAISYWLKSGSPGAYHDR